MSNIIIAAEHQSAPKESELNTEIRLAAQEITSGQWKPEGEADFWQTGTETIAQHPRVVAALERLQTRVQDRTNQEYLECAQQLHELNEASMIERRWPGQQRWQGDDVERMRLVNPMTPFEFIDKLLAVGISAEKVPTVSVEPKADADGVLRPAEVEHSGKLICLGHRVVRGVCGLYAHVSRGEGTSTYQRVGLLQVPLGPEWDLVRFDEYGVPVGKRFQGWRTALLGLIEARVLTEEQAHKAFGKPIENAASSFYRQQLQELRG